MAAVQDLRAGGRQSNAQYQYTLQSDNVEDLYTWTPKLVDALEHSTVLTDVSSDQQQRGLETYLDIDRDTSARLGITPQQIDNTLYDAFGQRQVSVIYSAINQYHVVMEIDPRYTQYPNSLRDVYVATSGGTPPGTATSNAPAGTVVATSRTAQRRFGGNRVDKRQQQCGAQRLHERPCEHRPRLDLRRRRGVHHKGNNDPARGDQPLPARPHAAVRQSPGIVRRLDHVVQSAAGQIARRGRGRNQRRHRPHQHAVFGHRRARRHGATVPAVAAARSRS